MKRILLSTFFMVLSTMPVKAYEGHYGLSNSINAGFRLSIPFGPTKKSDDKVKYGFQVELHREFTITADYFSHQRILKADLFSVNFSENGFKNLSLVGQNVAVYQNGQLEVVYFKKKKGMYYGGLALGVILGGAAVAGGFILIVTD